MLVRANLGNSLTVSKFGAINNFNKDYIMAIVSISKIQHRRGLQQDLPSLASAELGWSIDQQKLYIGNGTTAEGAPRLGNT